MKKFNKKVLTAIAIVMTVVATSVATSACWWFTYQPEEPKCLREE